MLYFSSYLCLENLVAKTGQFVSLDANHCTAVVRPTVYGLPSSQSFVCTLSIASVLEKTKKN